MIWGILDEKLDRRNMAGKRNADQVVSFSWPDLKVASRWANLESEERLRISGLTGLVAGERWVLAGSRDGSTKLFHADDGNRLHGQWPSPGGYPVQSVALNPAETLAASGTQDGCVQI